MKKSTTVYGNKKALHAINEKVVPVAIEEARKVVEITVEEKAIQEILERRGTALNYENNSGFSVGISNKNSVCQFKNEHLETCSPKTAITPQIAYANQIFEVYAGAENVGGKILYKSEDNFLEAYGGINKNVRQGEFEAQAGVKIRF